MFCAYIASSVSQQRGLELVGRRAHEGEARPPVQEVAVVGEAAAEFAVRDLPVVDVPVDEALEIAEIFDLQKGPLRHAGGRRGSVNGGPRLLVIHLVPVLAAQVVLRIDAQQIGDVGVEAVEDVELPRVDGLFDQVGVVVAHLGQAVGDVLGQRVVPGLEDEPQMRAFERLRGQTPRLPRRW